MFSSVWLEYAQVKLFSNFILYIPCYVEKDQGLSFRFFAGTVLKAEVRVTFPISSLSRNTPVMQAVLFEDPTDARFLQVWPLSQVRRKCVLIRITTYYFNKIFFFWTSWSRGHFTALCICFTTMCATMLTREL